MKSILLVPPPGSPLLATGPCGARPPVAYEWPGHGWLAADVLERRTVGQLGDPVPMDGLTAAVHRNYRCALVLLWHNEVCVEGCDRARRVLMAAEGAPAFASLSSIFDADDNAGPGLVVWSADIESTFYYEEKPIDSGGVVVVPALAGCPADLTGDARHAWALAIVYEARGLGHVVMIEEVSGG